MGFSLPIALLAKNSNGRHLRAFTHLEYPPYHGLHPRLQYGRLPAAALIGKEPTVLIFGGCCRFFVAWDQANLFLLDDLLLKSRFWESSKT